MPRIIFITMGSIGDALLSLKNAQQLQDMGREVLVLIPHDDGIIAQAEIMNVPYQIIGYDYRQFLVGFEITDLVTLAKRFMDPESTAYIRPVIQAFSELELTGTEFFVVSYVALAALAPLLRPERTVILDVYRHYAPHTTHIPPSLFPGSPLRIWHRVLALAFDKALVSKAKAIIREMGLEVRHHGSLWSFAKTARLHLNPITFDGQVVHPGERTVFTPRMWHSLGELSEADRQFLNRGMPVIVVSLGSMHPKHPELVQQAIAHLLDSEPFSDHLVFVIPGAIPRFEHERVRFAEGFAPFGALFQYPHVELFVISGSSGSVAACLYAGKKMLAVPVILEQIDNARMLGIPSILVSKLSGPALVDAVQHAMAQEPKRVVMQAAPETITAQHLDQHTQQLT